MNPDTSAAEAALKAKLSRKRTKTGCLTCRKRRIKCGEERPVCKNCIKSKRQCEGYSQRVVFKPPTFDYRPAPHGGAHITFQSGPLPEQGAPFQYGPAGFDPTFYQHVEHPSQAGNRHEGHSQNGVPPQQVVPSGQGTYYHPPATAHHQGFAPLNPSSLQTFFGPGGQPLPLPPPATPIVKAEPQHEPHPIGFNPVSRGFESSSASHSAAAATFHWQQYPPPKADSEDQKRRPLLLTETSPAHTRRAAFQDGQSAGTENSSPIWRAEGWTPRPELQRPIDYQPPPVTAPIAPQPTLSKVKASSAQPLDQVSSELYAHGEPIVTSAPPNFLNAAAVEAHDDDYYDVQSDEEMEDGSSMVTMSDRANERTLTQMLQRHSIAVQELEMRRYDTFIYDGILDQYRVDDHANPLRNRATAMVFAHFIAVTGPSLSIFERHLRSMSILFAEGQIPFPQQGLWTYTMPLAALRHRGLLHAMLALGSLHIARLQGASQTPSMQHYSWAVKRIRHCVGHPKKRLKVTTIAASMLLGFYEIMTADHTKWNMHLAGSKQLFLELDFSSMVRQFRRMKRERVASQMYSNGTGFPQTDDELLDQIWDVDERLVSELVGKEVKYEGYGHVMTPQSSKPPDFDLGKFAMLKDLFWWYVRQDAYQSIVSGNPLL